MASTGGKGGGGYVWSNTFQPREGKGFSPSRWRWWQLFAGWLWLYIYIYIYIYILLPMHNHFCYTSERSWPVCVSHYEGKDRLLLTADWVYECVRQVRLMSFKQFQWHVIFECNESKLFLQITFIQRNWLHKTEMQGLAWQVSFIHSLCQWPQGTIAAVNVRWTTDSLKLEGNRFFRGSKKAKRLRDGEESDAFPTKWLCSSGDGIGCGNDVVASGREVPDVTDTIEDLF